MTLDGYRFHIDVATVDLIGGWAFKVGDVNHHPLIEVRSGDEVLWSVNAATFREDLQQAGFGSGEFGFTLVPNRSAVTQTVNSASIYIDGLLALGDIPFFIEPLIAQKTTAEVELPEAAASAVLEEYRLHLDHYDAETVRGWVFKVDQIGHRAVVEVRCGDVVIASGLAEHFRQDVLEANMEDGYYGFQLTPRLEALPAHECECSLFVDGKKANTKPFVLSVDKAVFAELKKPFHASYQASFADEVVDFDDALAVMKQALSQEIAAINPTEVNSDNHVVAQLHVMTDKLAELSVRMQIIERILVKHVPGK